MLQRGVLLYYGSRAEAARGAGQGRGRKYLDAASLSASDTEPALIVLRFSDGDTHRLAVPQGERADVAAARQVRHTTNVPSCGRENAGDANTTMQPASSPVSQDSI